jgi:hypothetical protein
VPVPVPVAVSASVAAVGYPPITASYICSHAIWRV